MYDKSRDKQLRNLRYLFQELSQQMSKLTTLGAKKYRYEVDGEVNEAKQIIETLHSYCQGEIVYLKEKLGREQFLKKRLEQSERQSCKRGKYLAQYVKQCEYYKEYVEQIIKERDDTLAENERLRERIFDMHMRREGFDHNQSHEVDMHNQGSLNETNEDLQSSSMMEQMQSYYSTLNASSLAEGRGLTQKETQQELQQFSNKLQHKETESTCESGSNTDILKLMHEMDEMEIVSGSDKTIQSQQ